LRQLRLELLPSQSRSPPERQLLFVELRRIQYRSRRRASKFLAIAERARAFLVVDRGNAP
jgi:hypothetical protein